MIYFRILFLKPGNNEIRNLRCTIQYGSNKDFVKTLSLEVVSWNTKEFRGQSKECFEEIAFSLMGMRIKLTYGFEKHYDRFIETNNGCKIILGRGLDIFERREDRFAIGDMDQRWRKCKACEITYLKS